MEIRRPHAMLLIDMQKGHINAVVRLYSLNAEQRRLLLRAACVLSGASAAVALLPFKRAIAFGCVEAIPGARLSVSDCVWAVETAAKRLPWRAMCIEQGLAVQRMLRRAGVAAVLHYGARHEPASAKLEAHVWVSVCDETIVGGCEAADFAEIAAYPKAKARGR